MDAYPISSSSRRRRRRKRRGISRDTVRYDRWGRAVAGVVILSGVSIAIAAPAEDGASGNWLGVLQGILNPNGASGLRVGSLIVTPSVGLATTYDSNVFAARKHGHS